MNRTLSACALGIATFAFPMAAHAQNPDPVYIECDDKKPNPVRLVLALDPANNEVGVVEWSDYTIRDVSAVSFGPDKVTFTSTRTTGLQEYFVVSRIDASVSKTDSMFPDSVWNFKGCKVIDAPAERAF